MTTQHPNAKLIRPDVLYKESYIASSAEFLKEHQATKSSLDHLRHEFDAYLQSVSENENGRGLPKQFDTQLVFWLIDGDEVIGRAIIRHRVISQDLHTGWHLGYSIRPSKRKQGYGTLMLNLALQKAKHLGIKKVFLVCDHNNTPSKKMLEKAGAHFENNIPQKTPDEKNRLEFSLDLM